MISRTAVSSIPDQAPSSSLLSLLPWAREDTSLRSTQETHPRSSPALSISLPNTSTQQVQIVVALLSEILSCLDSRSLVIRVDDDEFVFFVFLTQSLLTNRNSSGIILSRPIFGAGKFKATLIFGLTLIDMVQLVVLWLS